MKLPNSESAIVDDTKVREHLLSPEHPVGRFKARVFAAAGYERADWQRLRDDLRALAARVDVELTRSDEFGQRFAGPAALAAPNGQPLPIITVWHIPLVGRPPRLVTAYPGRQI